MSGMTGRLKAQSKAPCRIEEVPRMAQTPRRRGKKIHLGLPAPKITQGWCCWGWVCVRGVGVFIGCTWILGQQKGQEDDEHQRGDPSWAMACKCNQSQRCLFLGPSTPARSAGWFFVGSALVPMGLLRVFPVFLQEVAQGGSQIQLCPPQYPQSRF